MATDNLATKACDLGAGLAHNVPAADAIWGEAQGKGAILGRRYAS